MTVAAWLEPLIAQMVESGMAPDTICGCCADEISELEKLADTKLPQTYVEFMLAMGKQAGAFLSDVLMTYPGIAEFGRSEAQSLVEGTGFELPADAFVFVDWDYGFLFFYTKQGDDPPVYRYQEGESAPEKVADSFTAWLPFELSSEIEVFKEAEASRRRIKSGS